MFQWLPHIDTQKLTSRGVICLNDFSWRTHKRQHQVELYVSMTTSQWTYKGQRQVKSSAPMTSWFWNKCQIKWSYMFSWLPLFGHTNANIRDTLTPASSEVRCTNDYLITDTQTPTSTGVICSNDYLIQDTSTPKSSGITCSNDYPLWIHSRQRKVRFCFHDRFIWTRNVGFQKHLLELLLMSNCASLVRNKTIPYVSCKRLSTLFVWEKC